VANFKYAVNTNSLPKEMKYNEIAEMLVRMKVEGIEWGLPEIGKAEHAAKEMRKVSNDYDLEIVSFINAGHLWKIDLMKKWSDIVKLGDGKVLRVSPPWVAYNFEESLHQPESYFDLAKKTREGLEKLVSLGKEYGIKYVVEMHSGSVTASAPLVRQIMEGLDSSYVGVIYDPANGIHEGWIRPRNVVELLGNYPDELLPRALWEIKVCPLEYGIVDYVEVYFALNIIGFKGWISLEEFFRHSPEIEIERALLFLKKCEDVAPKSILEPFTKFNE